MPASAESVGVDAGGAIPRPTASFAITLALVTAVGIGLRLAYVFTVAHHAPIGLDSTGYYLLAGPIEHGHGYSDGVLALSGKYAPTANFPPLYPAFLALAKAVGFRTVTQSRAVSSVAGAATIPLVALLGRRLVDARTGLVAAALVAVWPFLLATDGSLMSETIAVPLVTAALLATVWAFDGRRPARWALVGVLFALAALARAEAPVLLIFVVGAALLASRGISLRTRLAAAAVALVTFGVVSAPWVIYVSRDFGASQLWATDSAKTLAGSNCLTTYYGPAIGLWDVQCEQQTAPPAITEAEAARINRTRGIEYAKGHLGRAPIVAGVRVLRTAGLFHPRQQRYYEAAESRNVRWQLLAWWCYVAALPAAVCGLVLILRRNRASAAIVGALVGVAMASAISLGNQRLRMVVEPALLLCVATAVTAAWSRIRLRA